MRCTVTASDDEGTDRQTTDDIDEALDWFTNGVTNVFDEEDAINVCVLAIDGKEWGRIEYGGIEPAGEKKAPALRTVKGGKS